MAVLSVPETPNRHVHFPLDLRSGSHRSPEEFRIPRQVDDNNNNHDQRIFLLSVLTFLSIPGSTGS